MRCCYGLHLQEPTALSDCPRCCMLQKRAADTVTPMRRVYGNAGNLERLREVLLQRHKAIDATRWS